MFGWASYRERCPINPRPH